VRRKRKGDAYTKKCEALKEDGARCGAWALRESDPPRCRIHSLTPEELSAQATKAAKKSAFVRRSTAEPTMSTGLAPTVTLADVLRVCAPALEATFDHNGQPDWTARLAAAGTVLVSFPRQLRDTPEKVKELLESFLPSTVQKQQGMKERLTEANVYRAMREEWNHLRVRYHPVTGLFSEPYPEHLIGPSEDAKAVRAAQPKPEGELVHLPDGTTLLYRDGDLPQVVGRDDNAALLQEATDASLVH
jgi:hypothetical protein